MIMTVRTGRSWLPYLRQERMALQDGVPEFPFATGFVASGL